MDTDMIIWYLGSLPTHTRAKFLARIVKRYVSKNVNENVNEHNYLSKNVDRPRTTDDGQRYAPWGTNKTYQSPLEFVKIHV